MAGYTQPRQILDRDNLCSHALSNTDYITGKPATQSSASASSSPDYPTPNAAPSRSAPAGEKPFAKRKRANSAPPSPDRPACKAQKSNTSKRVTQDSEDEGTVDDEEDPSCKGTISWFVITFCTNYFMLESTTGSNLTSTATQPSAKRKRPTSAPPSPERPARKARKSNTSRRVIEDSEDEMEFNGEDGEEEEEEVREAYARLQADRLAEGSKTKV